MINRYNFKAKAHGQFNGTIPTFGIVCLDAV